MANKTCGECRYYHPIFKHEGVCTATSELRKTCDFTEGCAIGGLYPKPPPTNGDRIRQMSNEELAEFLDYCPYGDCIHRHDEYPCKCCKRDYLNAPAESEERNVMDM